VDAPYCKLYHFQGILQALPRGWSAKRVAGGLLCRFVNFVSPAASGFIRDLRHDLQSSFRLLTLPMEIIELEDAYRALVADWRVGIVSIEHLV
jgi:hypothetical protein